MVLHDLEFKNRLWSLRSKPTISFGQELLTTSINLTTAATISNKGILLEPKLIKHWKHPVEPSSSKRIITEETAQIVLEDMEQQRGGTAINARVDGVKVAAKAGLLNCLMKNQKVMLGCLASTIAIVDADNPKYIIYFAAKAPTKNSIWGSSIASPAIKNIVLGLKAQSKLN